MPKIDSYRVKQYEEMRVVSNEVKVLESLKTRKKYILVTVGFPLYANVLVHKDDLKKGGQ